MNSEERSVVCVVEMGGHSIQSFIVEEALDPSTKTIIKKYDCFCIRCGKSLDDIRNPKKTRAKRGSKSSVTPPVSSDQSSSDLGKLD